jgi:hypothetical protein
LLFMYTTTTTRSIKNRRAVWKYSKSSCGSKPKMQQNHLFSYYY